MTCDKRRRRRRRRKSERNSSLSLELKERSRAEKRRGELVECGEDKRVKVGRSWGGGTERVGRREQHNINDSRVEMYKNVVQTAARERERESNRMKIRDFESV